MTATPIPIESIVIRRRTQVTPSTILIFSGAAPTPYFLDTRGHLHLNSNFFFLFLGVPSSSFAKEPVLHFVGRSTPIGRDFFNCGRHHTRYAHPGEVVDSHCAKRAFVLTIVPRGLSGGAPRVVLIQAPSPFSNWISSLNGGGFCRWGPRPFPQPCA
jgi:hypothetical protein